MNSKPVVYIHIGTIKTGTTYIQKTFYENASLFEKFGVSYPYVFPPALNLPRYTNADFTTDRSRDDLARELIAGSKSPSVLISEEGIFSTLQRLKHPAFEGMRKKLILYVRRPADLLGAWAAEASEPYTAWVQGYHDASGPTPISKGIDIWSYEYECVIRNFIELAEELGPDDIVVRPFDRASFKNGNLLDDFLDCIGIDPEKLRADPEFRDPGVTNVSRSRKFYDISAASWELMGKPNQPGDYNWTLVNDLASLCQSGDDRSVIETLDDALIEKISDRFSFFEEFLSKKFFGGKPLFPDRYPSIYGKEREPYRAVDLREIQLQTELILQKNRFVDLGNKAGAELRIAIAERDRAIAERDQANQERDRANQERDLANQDRATQERDQTKADDELRIAIAGRDRAIVERDRAIAERDHVRRFPWRYLGETLNMRIKRDWLGK